MKKKFFYNRLEISKWSIYQYLHFGFSVQSRPIFLCVCSEIINKYKWIWIPLWRLSGFIMYNILMLYLCLRCKFWLLKLFHLNLINLLESAVKRSETIPRVGIEKNFCSVFFFLLNREFNWIVWGCTGYQTFLFLTSGWI